MPAPSTAITRLDLSFSFQEFEDAANRLGYVGLKILKIMATQVKSDEFLKITLESMLTQRDTRRATKSGYGRDDFETESDSFQCVEYGWESVHDDVEAKMYGDMAAYDQLVADRALGIVLNDMERKIAATVYDTSVWTGASLATDVGDEWNDFTNADPVNDVFEAKEKVVTGAGVDPNCLIINKYQVGLLAQCAKVQDLFPGATDVTHGKVVAALQTIFDIEHVIVAGGITNTAVPNTAAALSRIWSNNLAMVCRIATGSDLRDVCIGRTFVWAPEANISGDDQYPIVVEEYREEARRGGITRARGNMHPKILRPQAGHLLINIVT